MKTIQVSAETCEAIKDLLKTDEKPINNFKDFIGQKLFVRTVTYHVLGEVVSIVDNIMFLKQAAWIADSGRFNEFVSKGKVSESEYVGDWFVNINSIVDGCIWHNALITETI